MKKQTEAIFSRIRVALRHKLLEATARVEGFVSTVTLSDESTESNRAFYLVSLMLFISLALMAPDKIPQTFSLGQMDSGMLDRVQEVVKKAVPFIN